MTASTSSSLLLPSSWKEDLPPAVARQFERLAKTASTSSSLLLSSSWKEDLPPAVARQFERLAKLTSLPRAPPHTLLSTSSIGNVTSGHGASGGAAKLLSSPSQHHADPHTTSTSSSIMLSPSKRQHKGNSSTSNAFKDATSPHLAGNPRRPLSASSSVVIATSPQKQSNAAFHNSTSSSIHRSHQDENANTQYLKEALDVARARAERLEKRLNSRIVSDHFVGVDRMVMEEVFERRSIEAQHMELLHFVNDSWERVRCAMYDAHDASQKCRDMELLCRDSERDVQRMKNQLQAQDVVVSNLKLNVKEYSTSLEELKVLQADQSHEMALRVAAERQVAQLRQDKKRLKGKVEELEATVQSFRTDLEKLSVNHTSIVGDLEHSLKVMLLGPPATTTSANVTPAPTTAAPQSRESMADSIGAEPSMSSISPYEHERRVAELKFRLQDAIRELQETRSINRDLRAQISADMLTQQDASREQLTKLSSAEGTVSQLRKELQSRTKELKTAQAELSRLEGISRELGKCRGHLAIAERKIELLEKEKKEALTSVSESRSLSRRLSVSDTSLLPQSQAASLVRSTPSLQPQRAGMQEQTFSSVRSPKGSIGSSDQDHHVSFRIALREEHEQRAEDAGKQSKDMTTDSEEREADSASRSSRSKRLKKSTQNSSTTTTPLYETAAAEQARDSILHRLSELKRMQHLRQAGSQAILKATRSATSSSTDVDTSRETPSMAPRSAATHLRGAPTTVQSNTSISSVEVVVEEEDVHDVA
ncbi:Hypothetical protein, putative [Bodo saltans]|uniref:Uncharacterized protein n=1 Tax=Bodo saltans TaxID=75058 RepID=A0A0S4JBS1_BODSA|nr:Hypothetical protein, putative [Bodo saltans]|eukprot:CUG88846.1 Hypothetical protein, putative [Bodo saltans]